MRPTLSSSQRRFLKKLFPKGDCLLAPEELVPFSADASRLQAAPLAVVRPSALEHCVELMRWAQREDVPIYPRGRATNVVGACVPHPPGVVVSTLKQGSILEIDPDDFVAVVQPGVITADLQAAAAKKRLFYPPDPASVRASTIGGNVATCAGGMRALKYGVTRDYVLGLEAVLPGGEVIHPGGRTHKNVVGLDLLRLLVGSEGCLALVTEITLKLLPLPEATASLLLGFASMEQALDAARRVFAAGMLPAAMELMTAEVLDCLANVADVPWPAATNTALLLRLDGSSDTLPLELERLRKAVAPAGATYEAAGMGDEEEELWELRRLINPASYTIAPDKLSDDVTVPRGQAPRALAGIRAIGQRLGLTILTFGHLGDGNIHVNIMHHAATQRERALEAKKEVLRLVLSLGGSLSGEHGVGLTKKSFAPEQLGAVELGLMRKVKAAFDPTGIMNPGKGF